MNRKSRPQYRTFPFRPGAKPGSSNLQRATDALAIFEVLHEAHSKGKLTLAQLAPLFFRSTSDLVTYREGWKAGKFWSREAWLTACQQGNTNGLVSEHVLPRSVTLACALEMRIDQAKKFVWENSFECVITKQEDRKVCAVKATYPDDPWKRYAEAGVEILDVHHPEGTAFLSQSDRDVLNRHGILVTL